jgi:hypothetical protein
MNSAVISIDRSYIDELWQFVAKNKNILLIAIAAQSHDQLFYRIYSDNNEILTLIALRFPLTLLQLESKLTS